MNLRRLLAVVLTSLVATLSISGPAHAADNYRYWIYFSAENGSYVVSDKGVGQVKPADGSIQAFRYAAPDASQWPPTTLPRIDLATVTFDSVCGGTPAVDGQKRVAVLVDFGVDADAAGATVPQAIARCSQVAVSATTFQVVQKVAEVRSKDLSGPFICAIQGYPATGCGDAVKSVTPADDGFVTVATDAAPGSVANGGSDNNELLYTGIAAALVVLLGGGWLMSRRNKTTT